MERHYYITTPIYYVNARPHIGHAYTTIIADALARFKRQRGYDVFFLTGTDEHGGKIAEAARAAGLQIKEHVDRNARAFKDAWMELGIKPSRFIRTTDPDHEATVARMIEKLYRKGDVYRGEYEGFSCVPCETYFAPEDLKDGNCPQCGRPVQKVREENYFFRLSKYERPLLEHIEKNPLFIQPDFRRNEVLSRVRGGLRDISISRCAIEWGIKVPWDNSQTIYVWIDALLNYISGIGVGTGGPLEKYWPADLHLMAKDIIWFHAVIWPCLLMALELPLPKQVFAHGFWTVAGGKMSKSVGNVVDPLELKRKYGADAIRFFLLREVSVGLDGEFSEERLVERINYDLANDLGNLVNRSLSMAARFFNGKTPPSGEEADEERGIRKLFEETVRKIDSTIDTLAINAVLEDIWTFVRAMNKYVDTVAPWALARDPAKKKRLEGVMYSTCEAIRLIAVLIEPFMPETSGKIYSQLGIGGTPSDEIAQKGWERTVEWGGLKPGLSFGEITPIFPRIDKKSIVASEDNSTACAGKKNEGITEKNKKIGEEKKSVSEPSEIDIEDFQKIKLVTARVLEAERVPDTEKLVRLVLDAGDGEKRQIVAGIGKAYTPEELAGKTVILLANLKPRSIRGIESRGMLLAATENGIPRILTVDGGSATPGIRIS